MREGWSWLAVVGAVAVAAAPERARPDDAGEIVAEAAFLVDTLPPGAPELDLSLGVDGADAASPPATAARLQLALPLGERLGVLASAGLTSAPGGGLDPPAASLRLLLRAPAPDATGWAAALDVVGQPGTPGGAEVSLGLGALRQLGPVALRASASLASAAGEAEPHLHAGASAAVAPLPGWRALLEVVGEWSPDPGDRALAAGPTLKRALGRDTAVAASVLFGLAPEARPLSAVVQVSRTW